ncbi:MAG TPA: tetratricopeptide repeat protein [Acidobacteriota bacterium]|nr:tetratricopeptide repeat protein [Acidobacteriota bacterium]
MRLGAVLLIAVLAIVVRFVHVGADPPADVSWSQDLLTDPPEYTSYARSAVALGDWNPLGDERLIFFRKNITGACAYVIFSIFGSSIATANLTAVLLNLIALGFLAWGVGRAFGPTAGLGTAWLLAVNYLFVGYGRQPFLEVAANACLAFTFWAILMGARRWWLVLIGGLVAGAGTFFGKVTALHAAPIFLLGAALVGYQAAGEPVWRRWARPVGYAVGLGCVGLLWYLFAYRLASAEVLAYLKEQSQSLYGSPIGLASIKGFVYQWFSFGADTGVWTRAPILGVAGFAGLVWMCVHYGRRGTWRAFVQRLSPGAVLIVGWLVSGYLAFSPFNYRPVRYQIVLLFPLAAAAGWFLYRLSAAAESESQRPRSGVSWWMSPLLVVVLATGVAQLFLVNQFGGFRRAEWGMVAATGLMIAIAVVAGWTLLSRRRTAWTPAWRTRLRSIGEVLVALLLVIALVEQGRHFLRWWGHRQYTIAAANADLTRVVGPGAVLTGSWATPLAQQEDSPTSLTHFFSLEESEDFFSRYPITHVVVEDKRDGPFFQDYPDLARTAERVTTYTIRDLRVVVLRIAHAVENPEARRYVLTPFERLRLDIRGLEPDTMPAVIAPLVADSADTYSGWRLLGDAYNRIDSLDAALKAYQRALTHNPDDFVLLAQAGDVSWNKYRTIGGPVDRDAAAELWRRALTLNPGNPHLIQRLSRVGGP